MTDIALSAADVAEQTAIGVIVAGGADPRRYGCRRPPGVNPDWPTVPCRLREIETVADRAALRERWPSVSVPALDFVVVVARCANCDKEFEYFMLEDYIIQTARLSTCWVAAVLGRLSPPRGDGDRAA